MTNDESILRFNYGLLDVVPGQYSSAISLGVIGSPFKKSITYTGKADSGIFRIVGNTSILPGDGKNVIRIGCSPLNDAKPYYMTFKKEENKPQLYSDIGLLGLNVIRKNFYFVTDFNQYYVPVLRSSLPIIIDVQDAVPYNNLVV